MKNPVTMQIYLSRMEKQQFKNICYQLDTDMSRELRRMVREFIRNPPFERQAVDPPDLLEPVTHGPRKPL